MNLAEYLSTNGISQSAFGDLVGVTQGRVSQWLQGETIPAERCADIVRATAGAVTKAELRPDLWGDAEQRAA